MSLNVPVVAKLAFGDRVETLRNDFEQVEILLQSDAENKRAGAVALLATQFELPKEVLIDRLTKCRVGERSHMVRESIHRYLRPLTITKEFRDEKDKLRTLAKASFESHLSNIQHGSSIEKRAALLFAYNHALANSQASLELCEIGIRDTDPEIRCLAMSALARPHYATSNRAAASSFAKIALDEQESQRVRVYAAGIVLLIFGPFPLRPGTPAVSVTTPTEKDLFFDKFQKLGDEGIDGLDIQFLQACLTN